MTRFPVGIDEAEIDVSTLVDVETMVEGLGSGSASSNSGCTIVQIGTYSANYSDNGCRDENASYRHYEQFSGTVQVTNSSTYEVLTIQS